MSCAAPAGGAGVEGASSDNRRRPTLASAVAAPPEAPRAWRVKPATLAGLAPSGDRQQADVGECMHVGVSAGASPQRSSAASRKRYMCGHRSPVITSDASPTNGENAMPVGADAPLHVFKPLVSKRNSHAPVSGSTRKRLLVRRWLIHNLGVTYSTSPKSSTGVPPSVTSTWLTSSKAPVSPGRNLYKYEEPVMASRSQPSVARPTPSPCKKGCDLTSSAVARSNSNTSPRPYASMYKVLPNAAMPRPEMPSSGCMVERTSPMANM
mmetsp:Transcript_43014/g.125071  ORF Transcript_43014/g.125071 Transcript_43014/m.125071 type:complete len:266 (-) Transcript_43014:342-1139(-)